MRFTRWSRYTGTIHIRDNASATYMCGQTLRESDRRTTIALGVCRACKKAKAAKERRESQWPIKWREQSR